jgi:hypothetical protein
MPTVCDVLLIESKRARHEKSVSVLPPQRHTGEAMIESSLQKHMMYALL